MTDLSNQIAADKLEQTALKRAAREARWRTLWQKRGWTARMLTPLAALFLLIAKIRRAMYRTGFLDTQSAPVPMIVVGGIMIGGVGKTPVVSSLACALKNAGYKPAIISRGYTPDALPRDLSPRAVTELSLPSDVGDEPILHYMKTGLPVWVGRHRANVARMLCRTNPDCDVIICDDGLQHYALARDIEILIMDERGVGNGWCLPAGPLREPPSRLKEVDAVVSHHRCQDEDEARHLMALMAEQDKQCETPCFDFYSYVSDAYDLLEPSYRLPLSYFAGKSTLAIAGIAQPEIFFNMLSTHNIHGATMALPDHFQFGNEFVQRDVVSRAQYILMTEKDAVKYKHLIGDCEAHHQRFWVVPLEIAENAALRKLSTFLVQRLQEIAHEFE